MSFAKCFGSSVAWSLLMLSATSLFAFVAMANEPTIANSVEEGRTTLDAKQSEDSNDADNLVPAEANAWHTQVRLPDVVRIPKRDIEVLVCRGQGRYFPLFAFAPLAIEAYVDGGKQAVPLFSSDGAISDAVAAAKNRVQVSVQILEAMKGRDDTAAVRDELAKHPHLVEAKCVQPEMRFEIPVRLLMIDRAEGDTPVVIGHSVIQTGIGKVKHSLGFKFSGELLKRLVGTHRDDLTLEITPVVKAQISTVDLRANVTTVCQAAAKSLSELNAKPGEREPDLYIAMGGTAESWSELEQRFHSEVELEIWQKAGAVVDKELVTQLFFAGARQEIDLAHQDAQYHVAIVCEHGLTVDSAKGSVNETMDGVKKQLQEMTLDQYRTARQQSSGVGGGLSFMGVGANANVENMSGDELEKLRQRDLAELSEVQKGFRGDLAKVVGMTGKQLSKLRSTLSNTTAISMGQFRIAYKPLPVNVSFQLFGEPTFERYFDAVPLGTVLPYFGSTLPRGYRWLIGNDPKEFPDHDNVFPDAEWVPPHLRLADLPDSRGEIFGGAEDVLDVARIWAKGKTELTVRGDGFQLPQGVPVPTEIAVDMVKWVRGWAVPATVQVTCHGGLQCPAALQIVNLQTNHLEYKGGLENSQIVPLEFKEKRQNPRQLRSRWIIRVQ